ncbi:hypothetical protein KJ742_07410, partial [Patescibacteria group bacterium]|nr:hypothetical protein [Patescibacteria group bacterium]
MKWKHENYREFEKSRLVYMCPAGGEVEGGPGEDEVAEVEDKGPEAAEAPVATKDISDVIQGHHQEVLGKIDEIRAGYSEEHEHSETAQQFANELTEHTNGAFKFLQNEYRHAREHPENSDEKVAKIHAQAEQLKTNILDRLEGHEAIVEARAEEAARRPQFEQARTNLTKMVGEISEDITPEMLESPQYQEALNAFIENLADTRFNQLVGGEGLEEFELT